MFLVEVYLEDLPKELENVKIENSKLKDKYDITVVIIKRKNEYIMVNRDTIIEKGDTLTLHGPYQNIKFLFRNEGSPHFYKWWEHVTGENLTNIDYANGGRLIEVKIFAIFSYFFSKYLTFSGTVFLM